MQSKKLYKLLFLFSLICTNIFSQSDYINLSSKQYQLIDRLDIKCRRDSILNFSTTKPYLRKKITERVEVIDSLDKAGSLSINLSKVDKYNMRSLLMNNNEWTKNYQDSFQKRKGIFNTFFVNSSHLYATKGKDFVFIIDPLLNLQYGRANDYNTRLFVTGKGVALRGNIQGKIGFYSYITGNQERDIQYVQDFVTKNKALPGNGYFYTFGKPSYFQFSDVRGGITFNAGKHLDFQFAYDKIFLGNGYRSLFLSDFSNSYLFLKINAQIGKINYQTVFAETIAPFELGSRNARPRNYMALHHFSWQVTKWLNLGFYENEMELGKNGFQFSYLNPVMYYRAVELQIGAAGKSNVGLDFKVNTFKNVQAYGQLLINEFVAKEVLHYSRGSFTNKQALQLGIKYIDAFKINNLDLQFETNLVRPYTYTNFDSATNLTHYNQPLGHPVGANFSEFITIAKYQPLPKLYFLGKIIYYKQGLDSANMNFGADVFRSYNSRPRDYGFFIGSGIPVNCVLSSLTVSYELIENMFIELNTSYRTYNIQNQPKSNVSFYTFGLRWNMARRDFDF